MSSSLTEVLTRGSGSETMNRFSVVSLLTEGALALREGNEKRAMMLFGAATLATRYKTIAYPVQALVTLQRLGEKANDRSGR